MELKILFILSSGSFTFLRFTTYTAHSTAESDVVSSAILREEATLCWVYIVSTVFPRTSFEHTRFVIHKGGTIIRAVIYFYDTSVSIRDNLLVR